MSLPIQLPFEQAHPLELPPRLRTLREQGPVHRVRTSVGHEAWLVTGYQEVRSLLADDRFGRSHPEPDKAARMGESLLFGGPMGNHETEKADHARMRSLLQPHFSPGRMRRLRSRVATLTTELLDELAKNGSPADLHQAIALPLPILVICELLGVPYEDRAEFRTWSEAAGDVTDRERSSWGLNELYAYGSQLVVRKRAEPGDDVISRMCLAGEMADDEIAMMSMGVLFAGHETTVVQIGLGTLLLLTNPIQRQAVLDDPSMIGAMIEEMLRSPTKSGNGGGIPRYAHADVEVGDVLIRSGELVILDTSGANHDPAEFTDPTLFDIHRYGAAHLTFGHGPHYCIGAPLARIELQEVFSQLIPRFPTLRLAVPIEDLRMRHDTLTGGLVELPVAW
ncbi:cytochrome P450 [Rhizohabitans arisaemae]|uniref:cytochrome P450 n=1 Tax=Rhizohabitans arisaemae TaxID=2720610 RepID=UPI0024B2336E|nr:cytochrome P450 [Rhizohabitans arisaemae]